MTFLQKALLIVWLLVIGAMAIVYLDIIMKPLPTIERVQIIEEYTEEPGSVSLGEFEITHFCFCEICCGKWSDGITASGTTATENRTIAVDPNVIPIGTEVVIDGQVYIAEDTGSAITGNRIDVFVASHDEAINRGRITRIVEVKL